MSSNIHVAVVCPSNVNRSMEAHDLLMKKGFKVKSFGTADKVRLPGTSVNEPNCYEFGVPYMDIYFDLSRKDRAFYAHSGLLHMLDRNRKIKWRPEKFQLSTERFDIIITCEEKAYDDVIEWFSSKKSVHNQPVHIINIDIKDNEVEATIGAHLITDLVMKIARCDNLKKNVDELIRDFKSMCYRPMWNSVMFY